MENLITTDICPICNTDSLVDPLKCKTCSKSFCSKCAFLWKISKNQCPMKCSSAPWNIEIPDDFSGDYDGFIFCPKCKRLGSLKCPKSSCRSQINFQETTTQKSLPCPICNKTLKFFQAVPHDNCEIWSNSFYFFCQVCNQKFCDCIIKDSIFH